MCRNQNLFLIYSNCNFVIKVLECRRDAIYSRLSILEYLPAIVFIFQVGLFLSFFLIYLKPLLTLSLHLSNKAIESIMYVLTSLRGGRYSRFFGE